MTMILLALLASPWLPAADWQQRVHYTIEARLDESREVLVGAATLVYRNNSPEILDRLYFHLHLNAFRPNSKWAEVERRQNLDFQALLDPDYGYERLAAVRVGGQELQPTYPGAPDSVVVMVALPDPVLSGESVTVELEWEARSSTLCRRQCRRGRSYDFAQWYPRVAPYDAGGWAQHTLYPQGEFYGEYGTYDVTLDLPVDQIVGATGVPIEGDPGWTPAAGSPRSVPAYEREWYEERLEPASPGTLAGEPAAGRKRVRFYAEDVHHFAWSTSPDYIYEGVLHEVEPGRDVAIHVLYRPGDEGDWGSGTATERTAAALDFLGDLFGPYPYPQLTNLHRLEGGGTEFPMVIMDGDAGAGLIMHETAHQYAHGILGNNEWKEAWLDEGMASFLGSWAFEEANPGSWTSLREGLAPAEQSLGDQPIATVSEDFPDFQTYGYMAYTRPQFIYYMLREHLGEATFREVLRTYYDRFRFRHVTAEDLMEVTEEVSGESLGWFFETWWYTTATLDYGLGEIALEEQSDGTWKTTVEVLRRGEAWMPVTLQVGDQFVKLDSRDARQVVEVESDSRPAAIKLDPDRVLLDSDPTNDERAP